MCQLPLKLTDAVLDHCHTTGAVRGTAHRSCNALLGKVENNAARFGLPRDRMPAFLQGVGKYLLLHKTNITGMLHPTHKTEDEKRIAKNKKAVLKRAAAKKAK